MVAADDLRWKLVPDLWVSNLSVNDLSFSPFATLSRPVGTKKNDDEDDLGFRFGMSRRHRTFYARYGEPSIWDLKTKSSTILIQLPLMRWWWLHILISSVVLDHYDLAPKKLSLIKNKALILVRLFNNYLFIFISLFLWIDGWNLGIRSRIS